MLISKIVKESQKEYLKQVQLYGEKIARYDLNNELFSQNSSNKYDQTKSIIVYRFEGNIVYFIMERGEVIDYFEKKDA